MRLPHVADGADDHDDGGSPTQPRTDGQRQTLCGVREATGVFSRFAHIVVIASYERGLLLLLCALLLF